MQLPKNRRTKPLNFTANRTVNEILFLFIQATCSIVTLGRKDLKEKKKIIEELSKLKIQDRTVIGKDGVTKFYPVIRSPYILPIVFWTKFKIFLTAGTTLTVAADLLLSLNLGPGTYALEPCLFAIFLAPWPKITRNIRILS